MTCWPAINPRAIADECSPAHIANVLTDAKAMIAQAAEALEAALPYVELAADQDQDGAVAAMMLVKHRLALAQGKAVAPVEAGGCAPPIMVKP